MVGRIFERLRMFFREVAFRALVTYRSQLASVLVQNKPFKSAIRVQYDKWLEHGNKTYTKAGNIRSVSRDDICKMVAAASKEISEEVIKKSFLVTGQSKNSRPSDIACLKEGRECHSILPKVEEMWDQPLENLKKIENPCEIDESESDKNEMVIFDE